jgi:hypothetical protein
MLLSFGLWRKSIVSPPTISNPSLNSFSVVSENLPIEVSSLKLVAILPGLDAKESTIF